MLSGTHHALASPVVSQDLSKIVDPPLYHTTHISKYTKSPDFSYSCYSSSFTSFLASIYCLFEPSSYKEAIIDPGWQQDMDAELKALHKTNTWDLVPLPSCKSVVGCLWVYKIKIYYNGSIKRFKARLVTKDIHNCTIWIMRRLLHLLQKLLLFILFL